MSGTHEGSLLGVPATGRNVEWRLCHPYRFDTDGRAVEHDAIRDDVGLLRRFDGLQPAPRSLVRPAQGRLSSALT